MVLIQPAKIVIMDTPLMLIMFASSTQDAAQTAKHVTAVIQPSVTNATETQS
jgi:hypothetical protein